MYVTYYVCYLSILIINKKNIKHKLYNTDNIGTPLFIDV